MRSPAVVNEATDRLVQLGRSVLQSIEFSQDELKASVGRYSWINSCGYQTLNHVTRSISQEDLCSLIVGITYAEKELLWFGGSAAAVIHLFRNLQETAPQNVWEPIADWVIANRRNEYVPYGTKTYRGTTHAACMEYRRRAGEADKVFRKRLNELQKVAKERRELAVAQRAMTAKYRQ